MPTMGPFSCLSASDPYAGAPPTLLTPPLASASHACPATDELAMATVGGGDSVCAPDIPTPVAADSSRTTPAAVVARRTVDLFMTPPLRMPCGGQWVPSRRRAKTKMKSVTHGAFAAFV